MRVSDGAGRQLGAFAFLALSLSFGAGCKPSPERALEHGRSAEAKTRTRGIEELLELREAGVPGLIALLREPDAQKEARQALSRLGRPAVPGLIAVARDGSQPDPSRSTCIELLGELKAAEAISTLVGLLSDPNQGEPAHFALVAIGPAVLEPLAALLTDAGASTQARTLAVGVLSAVKGPRALEALLSLLRTDAAPAAVRTEALRALTHFEDPRAGQAVLDGLTDRAKEVRKQAFELFSKNPDPRALDTLLKVLDEDGWRQSAAEALGQLREPRGFERLGELLGRDGGPGRLEIIAGLATSSDPAIVPVVLRTLHTWDLAPDAYEIAVRLGWKPGSPDEQSLVDLAKHDKAALLARWAQVRPLLLADLQSKNGDARINAARWLILLGMDDALPPMLAALKASEDTLLATTYFGCGKPQLVKAASAWMERRKVVIDEGRDLPPIVWNRPPP
ncbi:MAG TPA: HEAT repeat domain-containing protein [Myxococcales bacterium]|jgi:HEAT repeat protein